MPRRLSYIRLDIVRDIQDMPRLWYVRVWNDVVTEIHLDLDLDESKTDLDAVSLKIRRELLKDLRRMLTTS